MMMDEEYLYTGFDGGEGGSGGGAGASDGHFQEVEPCAECGGRRVVVRDGFYHCEECGLRLLDSQPVLTVTREIGQGQGQGQGGASYVVRRIKRLTDKQKFGDMWTTWHALNMILIGFVDEISNLENLSPKFREVTLHLWCRWLRLNKIAFHSKTVDAVPKLPLGAKLRDFRVLMGVAKPKKQKIRKSKRIENEKSLNLGRKINKSYKTDLVKQEYEEYLESQQNTSDMKLSQLPEINAAIPLDAFAPNAQRLYAKTEDAHLKLHKRTEDCGSSCPFYRRKPQTMSSDSIEELSVHNLYAILYLALIVTRSKVQLSDVLRWIREGHLTSGKFLHFFPSDMLLNNTDRFNLLPSKGSQSHIRRKVGKLILNYGYEVVPPPDLDKLVLRYVRDFNLPHLVYDYAHKILIFSGKHKERFRPGSSMFMLPNYDAVALSCILVVLKMLFGVDGVHENEISSSAKRINEFLSYRKSIKESHSFYDFKEENDTSKYLFVWSDWTKHIHYRKICLSRYHYPTAMDLDSVNFNHPELYLHHKRSVEKYSSEDENQSKRKVDNITSSLLESMESNYEDDKNVFPIFSPSLYPGSSYNGELLEWISAYDKRDIRRDILSEDFSDYDVSYILNPKELKRTLAKSNCKLMVYKFEHFERFELDPKLKKYMSQSKNTASSFENGRFAECTNCSMFDFLVKLAVSTIETKIIPQQNEANGKCDRKSKIDLKINPRCRWKKQKPSKFDTTITLNPCYEYYWMRHYDFSRKTFSQDKFEEELDKNFPASFVWLLREFASRGEMPSIALYRELVSVEKALLQKTEKCKRKSDLANNRTE